MSYLKNLRATEKKPTRKMGLDLSGVTRSGKTDAERLREKLLLLSVASKSCPKT